VRQQGSAVAAARAATVHDPVDPDSTALLGSALLVERRFPEAEKAFRVAARFGWRNLATQGYWLDASLQANDLAHAMDRADAILRAHPRLTDEQQLLAPFERTEAGRTALAERLSSRPAWLKAYLTVTRETPADVVEQRMSVVSRMRVAEPLGCDLVTPLTRALLRIGQRPAAQALWNQHCPQRRVVGLLADPRFAFAGDSSVTDMPFSWIGWRTGDVAIRDEGSGADRVLLVSNAGPSPRIVLYQPVKLPPGRYVVKATGETEGPSAQASAALACNGRFPSAGTADGQLLAGGQTVVAGECANQQLGIWLTGNGSEVRLRSIELTAEH
jgi:hypothetical protein